MKTKYVCWLILLSCYACNSWLDIKPNTEIDKHALYEKERGFKDALAGCYIKLKSQDLYGRNMTMTTMEYLVQHWDPRVESTEEKLSDYDFKDAGVETQFDKLYEKLYNVINQANDIIQNASENKEVFKTEQMWGVVLGEALAIRAFCHLDILRIFGPVPVHVQASEVTGLVYMENVTKENLDKDTWGSYTAKLKRDLDKASELLAQYDPIMEYDFKTTTDPAMYKLDDFLMYRRFHFNYYAVEALKARFYLYTQDHDNALKAAMAVINAQSKGKAKIVELSVAADIYAEYNVAPNEHLMSLNIFDINTYIENIFNSNSAVNKSREKIERDLFDYSIVDPRFLSLWGEATVNVIPKLYVLKKYWQNSASASTMVSLTEQMVPIIRLSEIYLIAMETASLAQANELAKTYFESKDILPVVFTDDKQRLSELLLEYEKDFYGEGQMFYAYKRTFTETLLWYGEKMNDSKYVIPVPQSDQTKEERK